MLNKTNDDAFIAKQRALFVGSEYGTARDLRAGLDLELEAALQAGPEEAIQEFLTANPYLIQYVLPTTGHHGIWIFPKQTIRSQKANKTPGLIPDYLVAAKNSMGYTWHIVELKRADTQFANRTGDALSAGGHKAVVQCATYVTHFRDYIDLVRSNLGLQEMVQPKDVTIIIGDSQVENGKQRDRRREFENLAPMAKIASYDRIRQNLKTDLDSLARYNASFATAVGEDA